MKVSSLSETPQNNVGAVLQAEWGTAEQLSAGGGSKMAFEKAQRPTANCWDWSVILLFKGAPLKWKSGGGAESSLGSDALELLTHADSESAEAWGALLRWPPATAERWELLPE
ncbi:hypothetical protein SRHO_G00000750 [Serrasalmus rhombeus]